jgi:hypothetical protein
MVTNLSDASSQTAPIIKNNGLLNLRAYRCLNIRLGMPDNRWDDGVETSSCQRRKVSFQIAIALDQRADEFGHQHAAPTLTSGIYFRY